MTDKVQKIKDWISKEQDGLIDAQGNFEYPEHEGAYHILCNLDAYIDSLQEEPVSDDLDIYQSDERKLREHYAGMALVGYMSGVKLWDKKEEVAKTCVSYADALIAELRKE